MLSRLSTIVNSQRFQLVLLVALLMEGILVILPFVIGLQGVSQIVAELLFAVVLTLLSLETAVGIASRWPQPWQYFYQFSNTFTFFLLLLLLVFPSQRYAALLRIPRSLSLAMVPVPILSIKGLSLLKTTRISEIITFDRAFNSMAAHFRASFGALKESEARNRALLDAIPDLILEIDHNGTYLDYVEAKGQWLLSQTSPEDRIGKNVNEVLPPELARIYLDAIDTVLTTQTPKDLEYELYVNQTINYYEARVVAYRDRSALFMVRNITQRKQAEAELRHSEATNRALISAMPDLLIRMKGDGTYLGTVAGNISNNLWNAATQDQDGINIREILPPDRAEQRLFYIQQALETGLPQVYEQRLELEDKIQYEEVRIVVMGDDEVLNIIRDVTARKEAEQALRLANEELEQRVAQRTAELQQEKERSEQLLLNILPEPIAEQLKRSGASPAEHFEEVTILFADIVGFTELAARMDPLELVGRLNQIFSTFDRLVDSYGLEKIKTIGDAYMVVGGLPIPSEGHVAAIANLALDMQNHMRSQFDDMGKPLRIRIGINTGPVIAGVIGVKRFIYDLWGDAVNVAARMESHSEPGSIQVTEATYQLLKHQYHLEQRGTIPIRGRGKMTTYWLRGQRELTSLNQSVIGH